MQDARRLGREVWKSRVVGWIYPAVILASVIVEPTVTRVVAKDGKAAVRSEKRAERKTAGKTDRIARKIDDTTRVGASTTAETKELEAALEAAYSSRDSISKIKDYTALFSKRELLKDQLVGQVTDIKFRQEPFSVYLKYHEPHAGREVIFMAGRNKGNLLVHEDGFKALAGTLAFSPTAEDVMKENRYPITQIGLAIMLDLTIAQWEQAQKYGETDVKFYPEARIGEMDCRMIETSHAVARPHFKFMRTRLYIDKKSNLPLRLEQFGFPKKVGDTPPIIEEYTYSNLKINVGLTDHDFDTKNKSYNF